MSYSGTHDVGLKGRVEDIGKKEYVLILGSANPVGGTHFTCHGSHEQEKGESRYDLPINRPPVPGFCSLGSPLIPLRTIQPIQNPQHHFEFLKDKLQFTCHQWTDPEEHYPLTYELYAKIEGSEDSLLPRGVLLSYDVYPNMEDIELPLGRPFNFTGSIPPPFNGPIPQYFVNVSILVSDFYGLSYSPLVERVEVRPICYMACHAHRCNLMYCRYYRHRYRFF